MQSQAEEFLGFFFLGTELTVYALYYLRLMLFCFLKYTFRAANQNKDIFPSYSQY